jgi:hypothetical protein
VRCFWGGVSYSPIWTIETCSYLLGSHTNTSTHHQHMIQTTTGGLAFVGFVVIAFLWTVTADVYFLVTGKSGGESD